MIKSDNHSQITLAAFAFIAVLALTLITSYYIRVATANWINDNNQETINNVVTLTDSRFSNYVSSYHSAMRLLQTIYSVHPDDLKYLFANPKTKDILWVNHQVSLINNNEITTLSDPNAITSDLNSITQDQNVIRARQIAWKENRPVFFNRHFSPELHYLASIIPINEANNVYVYIDITYESLLNPVNQTKLLSGTNNISLKLYSNQDSEKEFLYATNQPTQSTINSPVSKRLISRSKTVKPVYWDTSRVDFEFTEEGGTKISNLLRQVPFTILIIGTMISLVVFTLVYVTIILYKVESTPNN